MSPLNAPRQRKLVDELVSVVRQFAPNWTDSAQKDPGVTILEVMAWLIENLEFSTEGASPRQRALLSALRDKLAAISPDCCDGSDLTRPRYFSGRLLTASDFQEEQDYTRKMMWLHNRCFFGSGIVKGLGVALDPDDGQCGSTVTVSPGCAIDCEGRQLRVCQPLRCTLQASGTSVFLVVRYSEQMIDPQPAPDGKQEFTRIKEGVAVDLTEKPPVDGVALARLLRRAGKWRLDRKFRPTRFRFPS